MLATAVRRLPDRIFAQYPPADLLAIRLPLLLLFVLPILAPTLLPTSGDLSLAVTVAIYVIVANGLHIVFSYAGQLSLAHTTLWGVGAYAAALLLIHYDLPTLALVPAAGVCGALAAIAIGVPAFRTAGFSFAIITFAFAEIARLIANNWVDLTEGSIGLTIPAPATSLGPISFDTFDHLANFYYLTLAFAYLSLIGIVVLNYSSLGRSFIAIRENEALARSLGINVYLHKLIALALSGFFAGVAGVFLLYHAQHIDPGPLSQFGAFYTVQFLLMILIGGRFSMLGPTIGAVVAVFGPDVLDTVVGGLFNITANRIQILFGAGLILSVLTAPNGIVGQAKANFNRIARLAARSRVETASPVGATSGGD